MNLTKGKTEMDGLDDRADGNRMLNVLGWQHGDLLSALASGGLVFTEFWRLQYPRVTSDAG